MRYYFTLIFTAVCFGSELPADPDVTRGTLENGLTYYIRKTRTKNHHFAAKLVVKTGSLNEKEDERGLAHLTEHMVFRGTKNFPNTDTRAFFDSMISRALVPYNASTSFCYTEFRFSHYSADKTIVHRILEQLNEMMFEATFAPDLLEKEKKVVCAEEAYRYYKPRPNAAILEEVLGLSAVSAKSPIGDMDIVKNVSAQKLLAFYKREYRPDKMALIVSSNLENGEILDKIQSIFTKTVEGKGEIVELPLNIQENQEPKVVFHQDPSSTTNRVVFEKTREVCQKDYYEESAIRKRIFGAMCKGVINEILTQRRLASAKYLAGCVGENEYTQEVLEDYLYVNLIKEEEKQGLKAFAEDLVAGLSYLKSSKGIKELMNALDLLKHNLPKSVAFNVYKYLKIAQTSFMYGVNPPMQNSIHRRLRRTLSKVTENDILDFVKEYEKGLYKWMSISVGTSEGALCEDDVTHLFENALNDVHLTQEKKPQLQVQDSWWHHSYSNQINDYWEPWYQGKGYVYKRCKNGLFVYVIKIDSSDSVFRLTANGGMDCMAEKDLASYVCLQASLCGSGLSNLDQEAMRVYLCDRAIKMDLYCHNTTRGVNFMQYDLQGKKSCFNDVFALINACLEKRVFKKEVFNFFVKDFPYNAKNCNTKENFAVWLKNILYCDNPYYTPGVTDIPDEQVAGELCKKLFSNPKDFVLGIFTNKSLDAIDSLVYQYLSPICNKTASLKRVCPDTLAFATGSYTYYEADEKSSWGYVFIPYPCDKESSVMLEAKDCLQYILQNRLFDKLYSMHGLSYAQGAQFFSPGLHSNYSILQMTFNSLEENMVFMHQCVEDILIDLFANGITSREYNDSMHYFGKDQKCQIEDISALIDKLREYSPLYISKIGKLEQEAS